MTKFLYTTTIKASHLDKFGHVNNAAYLTLLEEARWDFLNKNNYGMERIEALGLGPTILEIKIRFSRELKLNDTITIQTQVISYAGKIAKLTHEILRDGDICCSAEYTMALFDLNKRKLVLPTKEWLKAIGFDVIK